MNKLFLGVLPLVLAGCVGPNPNAAFGDVEKTVNARTVQQVRWIREGTDEEFARAVEQALQTTLTAEAAVKIALLNNRSLQAEFEEIGISQAEFAQASRIKNIEIAVSWRFPDRPPSAVNAEYSAATDLLDLLMLPARKKIAAQTLEQTKLRIANEVLKLVSEVQTAFYTLQAREQFIRRLSTAVEINEAGAELSKRQHDAGNINELELFNQQAAYSQSRVKLAQEKLQARRDRERVNRLLGLWGKQTDWKAADGLPALPEKELILENLESLGVNQRLELALSRMQMESVAGALRLKSKSRFFPGAKIGVDTEREPDGQRVTGPTLALELPIFDQGQSALARLGAQYRQAQRKFEALAVNVRSEIREAQDALVASRDATAYYEKVLLPQHQRILQETLLQYNGMQVGAYQLLTAKQQEIEVERDYIETWRDYWIARAELERAIGGRLPKGEAAMTAPVKSEGKHAPDKDEEKNDESHEHNHKH